MAVISRLGGAAQPAQRRPRQGLRHHHRKRRRLQHPDRPHCSFRRISPSPANSTSSAWPSSGYLIVRKRERGTANTNPDPKRDTVGKFPTSLCKLPQTPFLKHLGQREKTSVGLLPDADHSLGAALRLW